MRAKAALSSVMVAGARVVLGLLFIWSGLSKVRHPYDFLSSVYSYELVGRELGLIIAQIVPWLEMSLGVCLLGGICLGGALLISALLLLAFTGVQYSAIWRGLDISCGCFGSLISRNDLISYGSALRTVLLMALAVAGYISWRLRPRVGSVTTPAAFGSIQGDGKALSRGLQAE